MRVAGIGSAALTDGGGSAGRGCYGSVEASAGRLGLLWLQYSPINAADEVPSVSG